MLFISASTDTITKNFSQVDDKKIKEKWGKFIKHLLYNQHDHSDQFQKSDQFAGFLNLPLDNLNWTTSPTDQY